MIRKVLPLKANFVSEDSRLDDSPMQVLLIDQSAQSMNGIVLKEMYFNVIVMKDFEESFTALEISNIDIVVVDLDSLLVNSSVEDVTIAIALIKHLKEAVLERFISIVGLTKTSDYEIQKKYMTAGARDLLSYPLPKRARETLVKYGRLHRHISREIELMKGDEVMTSRSTAETGQPASTSQLSNVPANTAAVSSPALPEPSQEAAEELLIVAEQENATATNGSSPARRVSGAMAATRIESDRATHSVVGTVHFMSPEIIIEQRYGRSVDWWACGCTFFECTVH